MSIWNQYLLNMSTYLQECLTNRGLSSGIKATLQRIAAVTHVDSSRLCHNMNRPSRTHVMNETHTLRSSDVHSSSISGFYDFHDPVNNLDE